MPDFKLTIEIKDVALGDVRMLADEIMEAHGGDFDASRGDFVISASERLSGGWFPFSLEGEA